MPLKRNVLKSSEKVCQGWGLGCECSLARLCILDHPSGHVHWEKKCKFVPQDFTWWGLQLSCASRFGAGFINMFMWWFSKNPSHESHSTVYKRKTIVVQVSLLCFCCVPWPVWGLCWQNWSTPHSKPELFPEFLSLFSSCWSNRSKAAEGLWGGSEVGARSSSGSQKLSWPVLGRVDCIQMLTPHPRPWICCSQIWQRDSWKHRLLPGREADSHDVWSLVSLSCYANGMKHIPYYLRTIAPWNEDIPISISQRFCLI